MISTTYDIFQTFPKITRQNKNVKDCAITMLFKEKINIQFEFNALLLSLILVTLYWVSIVSLFQAIGSWGKAKKRGRAREKNEGGPNYREPGTGYPGVDGRS